MRILAIETSCDETACSVIEDGTKIITNVVASSTAMHEKWGGIVPEVAAREQLKSIIPVIVEAMTPFTSGELIKWSDFSPPSETKNMEEINLFRKGFEKSSTFSLATSAGDSNILPYKPIIEKHIDAVAVTVGPGLIGSLLIGVEVAKTIAYICQKPLIPVNHVLAHMYANFLETSRGNSPQTPITFPAVSLVVSGGHTELFLMTSPKDLKWLGGTIVDAAGEAFDKTARLLGFGARGGLAIQKSASSFNIQSSARKIHLPRPMIHDHTLNFSFSGLKTAILREVNMYKENNQLHTDIIQQLSYEVQEAITDVLVQKTIHAASIHGAKSILLGGGVAANLRLREKFISTIRDEQLPLNMFTPPISLCTDNAAYIGSYAFFRGRPVPWNTVDATPDLSVEV